MVHFPAFSSVLKHTSEYGLWSDASYRNSCLRFKRLLSRTLRKLGAKTVDDLYNTVILDLFSGMKSAQVQLTAGFFSS